MVTPPSCVGDLVGNTGPKIGSVFSCQAQEIWAGTWNIVFETGLVSCLSTVCTAGKTLGQYAQWLSYHNLGEVLCHCDYLLGDLVGVTARICSGKFKHLRWHIHHAFKVPQFCPDCGIPKDHKEADFYGCLTRVFYYKLEPRLSP